MKTVARFLVAAICVIACSYILPGAGVDSIWTAIVVAAIFEVAQYLPVKPILHPVNHSRHPYYVGIVSVGHQRIHRLRSRAKSCPAFGWIRFGGPSCSASCFPSSSSVTERVLGLKEDKNKKKERGIVLSFWYMSFGLESFCIKQISHAQHGLFVLSN